MALALGNRQRPFPKAFKLVSFTGSLAANHRVSSAVRCLWPVAGCNSPRIFYPHTDSTTRSTFPSTDGIPKRPSSVGPTVDPARGLFRQSEGRPRTQQPSDAAVPALRFGHKVTRTRRVARWWSAYLTAAATSADMESQFAMYIMADLPHRVSSPSSLLPLEQSNGIIGATMSAKDLSASSSAVAFASLGRSILSLRRDQAMDSGDGGGEQQDALLLGFQSCVEDVLVDLSAAASADGDGLLSIAWIRRLLHAFLLCHEELRALLLDRGADVARPPADRLVAEYYDRAIKALDICNAARDGIEQIRRWRGHLEIVVAALRSAGSGGGISEGQVRRARKALADLAVLMLEDRDANSTAISRRYRSFGRSSGSGSGSSCSFSPKTTGRQVSNFRSLSWSVSRSWSAARQLQAIGSNLAAPRGHEVVATAGLAVPVYTASAVLLFTMWCLVAAIPCQDRGLQVHFAVPRTFPWASAVTSLHERIVEESKKRDRKTSAGLLKEIQQIERCTQQLTELMQAIKFPMAEGEEKELNHRADELAQICDALKEGLEPLERQVREIFLRIVRSRTESLNSPAQAAN